MKMSSEFPGFHEIPNFPNYLMSRRGEVINRKTRKLLKPILCPEGYYRFGARRADGKLSSFRRARTIGILFIPHTGDLEELVINHLNGVKWDDRISNLEWCSQYENILHAGRMGLSPKCLPMQVRYAYTGDVLDFPSIVECARYFNVSKDTINYRVYIGDGRIFPNGMQYRLMSEKPWYIPKDISLEIKQNRDHKGVVVRDVFHDTIKEYNSSRAFCIESGWKPATVSVWLSKPNQPILPGLIQIKWSYDDTPWRRPDDPLAEFNETSDLTRIVQVVDDATGQRYYFTSCRACAEYMEILQTTLNWRLKSNGQTVYPDGYRYSYYSTCPIDQKWSDGILLN